MDKIQLDKIIQGCKKGKRTSQDELVRLFAPKVMGICLRYCKDKNIANDALQEAFIRILKYIKTYKGKGSFEGWIRKTTVHASMYTIKKIRPIHFVEETVYEQMPSNLPDANSLLNAEDLLKLIHQLPSNQNIVFNLKIIEGYSHKEIGELLHIKTSTSRSTLTRARINLVRLLKQTEPDLKTPKKKQAYEI